MQDVKDLTGVLRGGTPLVIIETYEEPRVLELLKRVAGVLMRPLYGWSVTQGLKRLDREVGVQKFNAEPTDILAHIKASQQQGIYVLCDFHPYVVEAPRNVRMIKEIALEHETLQHTLVMVSHAFDVPPELSRYCAHFSLSMPGQAQLENLIIEEARLARAKGALNRLDEAVIPLLAGNLRGLSHADARRLARKAIWDDGALCHSDIPVVNKAKFALLDMEGVLQFEYDTCDFADVAGLSRLKEWLNLRRLGSDAQAFDKPKGVMLLGVQGSGKSLAAKAVAGIWQRPLLRLDMAGLYNKYIGETERNLKKALEMAELMAPCVLWIDEIEKGLGSSNSDEGTSKRILGTLLTWMAERKSEVFMVATANDISALPPELLRKGRLDEIFFVDLPDSSTREEIFRIHCRKRNIDPAALELASLASASEGFSGAEIEQAVISARYAARAAGQEANQAWLLDALSRTRPLSVVMAEKLNALRQWANGRTVMAHG
ncbi:AAA family ATPase [Shewanella indica]|uniref:AAA family ATPase n=1 Tax=Shewanella indica TaxID=768528 RepID=UPI003003F6F4